MRRPREDTKTHTEKKSRDNGGRDSSNVSTSQEHLELLEAGRGQEGSPRSLQAA